MTQTLAKLPTAKVPSTLVAAPAAQPAANDSTAKLDIEDRRYQLMGLTVLIGVLGVFMIWAAFAPLNSAVVASGRIVVDVKKQVVQHREGGVIQQILVDDGDLVHKGQTLMVLSAAEAQADQGTLYDQLLGYVGLEARLNAELEGIKLSFPAEITANTSNPERAAEIIKDETQQFKVRQSASVSEQTILKQRLAQTREQIQGVNQQIVAEKALEASYAKEAKELRSLFEKQLISNLQLNETDRKRLATSARVAELSSKATELKVQASQVEEQLLLQQNEQNKAIAAQLSDTRLRLTDVRNRLGAAEDRLQRTEVVAPESGTVVNMNYHTVGGVVQQGSPILEIVPRIDSFQIEANVGPSDIDQVQAGQAVDIRFPAFASSSFLKVTPGEVKLVSADTVQDEQTGEMAYKARIAITPEGVVQLEKNGLQLMQGMPAEASIKTGERTFLDYLLKPISNMFNHAFNEE
ncbi:HlyD family type I secretion periplasmic adaptor subunit [Thiothrix winogradskyi]|uniref:Membrane fusion protein (MFP) family protein n=1 Tax=Thiothrix winogradskyi TaxID=96472 RepID=A0ABY3SXT3_9GAMM|nr:HlyD family type I secretion periplasmic adaptor subunit [Thiothrix winogradskyi]UJS24337.1 HlyD family type I secretion periplasmic adaptor subunit [Thiothrix winogradskyi]